MHTLILLPGLACDEGLWHEILPALRLAAPRVQVSTSHTRHSSLGAMAAALLAETPGPLRLAGCSMGGMLALEVWRQAPQRVQGLALLGTSARADTPELLQLRRQAIEQFAVGRMEEVLRANVLFAFHPLGAARPGLVEDYLAMIRRAGAQQLITQNRAVMARADRRAELPQISCPVLVACGEADQITPPEHAREMAAAMAHARLEIVPGAGHMLTMEQPARVGALLQGWLADLDADHAPRMRGVQRLPPGPKV
jgi:pimeloyl-ACP methyl ester carboxylesterase